MEKMNPDYSAIISLPFGVVGLQTTETEITRVDFLGSNTALKKPETAPAIAAVSALKEYVENPQFDLTLPLRTEGTQFQQNVWRALTELPSGETITYSELAQQLDSGARAVGNACRANPVPLFVPCHRVVAKNGIGGYSGDRHAGWTKIKTWLLAHERP